MPLEFELIDAGERNFCVVPLDGPLKGTQTYGRTDKIARDRFIKYSGRVGDRYEVYSEWINDEEHRERRLVGRGIVGVGYTLEDDVHHPAD